MARHFEVKASPLNVVKLDLAIILVVGILLLFVIGSIIPSVWVQILVLLIYGMSSMSWIIHRTRQVVKELEHGQKQNQ